PWIGCQSFLVELKNVVFLKRSFFRWLGKRQLHGLDSPPSFEPTHRVLHLRVIQVRVQNGIARFEFVIPADEGLQRLRRTSRQSELVALASEKVCDRVAYHAVCFRPLQPRKKRIVLIYELGEPLVFSEQLTGHDSPVTVLKISYLVGDVIVFRDRLPTNLVVR